MLQCILIRSNIEIFCNTTKNLQRLINTLFRDKNIIIICKFFGSWRNNTSEIFFKQLETIRSFCTQYRFGQCCFVFIGIRKSVAIPHLIRKKYSTRCQSNFDGKEYSLSYPLIKSANGEYLIPFESRVLPDRLGVEWDWDNETKVLPLKSRDHEVIFKVTGKDTWATSGLITEKATKSYNKLSDGSKFLVDGVEKDLGYECYTFDGMPVLPLKKLCDIFGYKYDDSTGIVTVETCHKFYYDAINSQVPGEWEFNFTGSTEGWISPMMSLETMDGYMHCVSITNNSDPVMRVSSTLDLSQYTKIEVRIRVNVDKEGFKECSPYFYFITDKDRAWGENKKIKTTDVVKNHGDWTVVTYDLTAVETWKDKLVTLRLDPFDAVGSCDIDYIRLIK